MMQTLPAFAILGPTASGKSGLGLAWANAGLPIEMISLDSALVFQDMNIGTAKPSANDLAAVPHHLINLITPEHVFNASDFVERCLCLVAEIRARNRIPIILGGTMMYYKALIMGLDEMPKTNLQVRAEIEKFAATMGWPHLHQELLKVDPITAQRLKPNDSQRISRALEVYRLIGKPISSLQRSKPHALYQIPTLALLPNDRLALHTRIQTRFKTMLASGFVDEVVMLKQKYSLNEHLPSMRCVGYRQVWQYLEQQESFEGMTEKGIAATRQLAKRQLTWLRSFEIDQYIDPFEKHWEAHATDWLTQKIAALY